MAAITAVAQAHQAGAITIRAVVEAGPYAVLAYGGADNEGGGQALLVNNGAWSLIVMGGGTVSDSASSLMSLGVPTAYAQPLVDAIAQAGY